MNKYQEFLEQKKHISGEYGFEPLYMPEFLFDFQKSLVTWATKKGRSALFADCGMGKTAMQLVWAQNIVQKTNGKVLILTPLAVAQQTVKEADKFGIEAERCSDGKHTKKIVVTNYERLHYFNPADFVGCVCDESSILKNFDGETKKAIVEFMKKLPYRLLCTATAAPNDFMELGNSSEALGEMKYAHMLAQFFVHDGGDTQKWRLKKHSERDFWRWVCSWARAIRKPSDMGFCDSTFKLPSLIENLHIVDVKAKNEIYLFDMPVVGLDEQRAERKRSLHERCEMAAKLVNARKDQSVSWGYLNNETNLLKKLIKDSVEVSGSDSDDKKEESFTAFQNGQIKCIVTKPSIASFGLNWQHCAHQTFFPSHSYEQYYQAIRRSWRFGQKKDVCIDIITTIGEGNVLDNLQRKSRAADKLFEQLVSLMNNELKIQKKETQTNKIGLPIWIQ
jgi:hypothetical protein